ncbi:MAG: NADH:flavin oxidoreductase [Candidatus Aminicenantes bacterium]|nr:NADH:flavin oxidoreductase [Candidatus Aminicenantes bacterium]
MSTSILFSPIKIGSVEIKNRFVRSATHDFMAEEDGSISERQLALYRQLAQGEVGLIISGHAYVLPSGKASPRQIAIYDDKFIPGLKELVKVVHQTESRLFLQLSHAGRQTKEKICGCQPLAPSAVYEPVYQVMPREITIEEIEQVIEAFIQAAKRAKEAGFDGLQLHCAHGYLLSSFLSPYTNRRQDEWGGSLENRAKVILEILRGIKKKINHDFPIIVKLNSSDYLPNGLEVEEAAKVAQMLEAEGLAAIEVSGGSAEAGKGSMWPGVRPEEEEGYFVPAAKFIKKIIKIPVIGLGGLRTFRVMERLVASGEIDLVSMSRPFIREPDLIIKFKRKEVSASQCISCNKCFNPRGIACAEIKKEKLI